MNCPVCRSPLLAVEKLEIELDCCAVCRGIWFDEDELELLLASAGVERSAPLLLDLLRSPEAETREARRACPRCKRRLRKVRVGDDRGAVLDLCPRGDGVWLEPGELARVVDALHGSGAAGDRVAEYLGLLGAPPAAGVPEP
jgi:Zn-finger nucleic acid-binding protein